MEFTPGYIKLSEKKFNGRIEKLHSILRNCELCPRKCHVNRLKGERGYCKAGKNLEISSYGPHFGEESVLVGQHGSGTIFLTWCNLKCSYCQNYEISITGKGNVISGKDCAKIMLHLQKHGCHNINFVTPTHFTPQLVKAIKIATEDGLKLPIIWNCGGYEHVEVIKLLEGIIDIYMPDIKYSREDSAKTYSHAADYFERCKEAVKEMYRQVGDLQINKGIAQRGLLISHLILPNDTAGSEEILHFIAREISPDSYVNIMAQYHPCGNPTSELNRCITKEEFHSVINTAKSLGLTSGLKPTGIL